MAPIRFEEVRTQEQLDEVTEFAQGFQHIIDPRTALPMVMLKRGDRKVGYFHVFQHPVISFAFHVDPDICSPRDFRDSVEAVKHWRFGNSMSAAFPNGVCFAHVPEHPIIPLDVIRRMGFEDREKKLWQANG